MACAAPCCPTGIKNTRLDLRGNQTSAEDVSISVHVRTSQLAPISHTHTSCLVQQETRPLVNGLSRLKVSCFPSSVGLFTELLSRPSFLHWILFVSAHRSLMFHSVTRKHLGSWTELYENKTKLPVSDVLPGVGDGRSAPGISDSLGFNAKCDFQRFEPLWSLDSFLLRI